MLQKIEHYAFDFEQCSKNHVFAFKIPKIMPPIFANNVSLLSVLSHYSNIAVTKRQNTLKQQTIIY